jgi:hypothetical protein
VTAKAGKEFEIENGKFYRGKFNIEKGFCTNTGEDAISWKFSVSQGFPMDGITGRVLVTADTRTPIIRPGSSKI